MMPLNIKIEITESGNFLKLSFIVFIMFSKEKLAKKLFINKKL